jgi:hypothetical protein
MFSLLANQQPVLKNINNSTTWMPIKVGATDRTSAFALQRQVQPALTDKRVVMNRFIGGNRDASAVAARKRLERGDVRSLVNSFAPSDAVSKRDVYSAYVRTRRHAG